MAPTSPRPNGAETESYFIASLTEVYLPARLLPSVVTTPRITMLRPAAIMAYSIAVAPRVSAQKREIRRRTALSWVRDHIALGFFRSRLEP